MDLIELLQPYNIPFRSSGVNVTEGWVEIKCPFCFDPSYHMGISNTHGYHCWRCGKKGHFSKVLPHLLNMTKEKSELVYAKISRKEVITEKILPVEVILPKAATKNFSQSAINYLKKRRFDEQIIDKYNLYYTNHIGDYKFRIIIPIYENGSLVCYTSRSIVDTVDIRYKNCPDREVIVSVKSCIYNLDTVTENRAIIVEGPTDVWRIGDGCAAIMGMEYTQIQIRKLSKLKKALIMFDGEKLAISKAYELGKALSAFIPKIEIIELDSGDPADLSDDEVFSIRKDFFG